MAGSRNDPRRPPPRPARSSRGSTATSEARAPPGGRGGGLTSRGYCAAKDVAAASGKIVVCFNTKRKGLPSAAERTRAAAEAGAAGLIEVDDPHFSIEPPRWPAAYARTVVIGGSPPP